MEYICEVYANGKLFSVNSEVKPLACSPARSSLINGNKNMPVAPAERRYLMNTTIATANEKYVLLYINNKFVGKCRKEDVEMITCIITDNRLNVEVKTRGARQ